MRFFTSGGRPSTSGSRSGFPIRFRPVPSFVSSGVGGAAPNWSMSASWSLTEGGPIGGDDLAAGGSCRGGAAAACFDPFLSGQAAGRDPSSFGVPVMSLQEVAIAAALPGGEADLAAAADGAACFFSACFLSSAASAAGLPPQNTRGGVLNVTVHVYGWVCLALRCRIARWAACALFKSAIAEQSPALTRAAAACICRSDAMNRAFPSGVHWACAVPQNMKTDVITIKNMRMPGPHLVKSRCWIRLTV